MHLDTKREKEKRDKRKEEKKSEKIKEHQKAKLAKVRMISYTVCVKKLVSWEITD